MMWLLTVSLAKPLPAWVEDDRLIGFVELADAIDLSALEPAEPEGHEPHGIGRRVTMKLEDEALDLDALLALIVADENTVKAEVVDGAVEIEHPDPLTLLDLPVADDELGAHVTLERTPPPPPARHVLTIENIASARAEVSVEGVKLGRIGPYTTAIVKDVPAGTYEVAFEMPNGYVRRAKLATRADGSPGTALRMR